VRSISAAVCLLLGLCGCPLDPNPPPLEERRTPPAGHCRSGELALAEADPWGISGVDALAFAATAPARGTLVYGDGRAPTTIAFDVEAVGARTDATVCDPSVYPKSQLQVGVELELRTEDGAFAETTYGLLRADTDPTGIEQLRLTSIVIEHDAVEGHWVLPDDFTLPPEDVGLVFDVRYSRDDARWTGEVYLTRSLSYPLGSYLAVEVGVLEFD